MGADAKESLAHDDKRRDVEDKIRGQIVEIQAIVEHEPPDKWVEREAQSAKEMGEEHHPLMGPGGGDERPSSGSRCAISLDRYPAPRSFLMCSSIMEEANHLPPAPDMTGEG